MLNEKGFAPILILFIALALAAVPTLFVVSNEIKSQNYSSQPVLQEYDPFLAELDQFYAEYRSPQLQEGFLSVLNNELGASYGVELNIIENNKVVYRIFATKSGQTVQLEKGSPSERIVAHISVDYETAKELLEEYKQTKNIPKGIPEKILDQKIVITPIQEALKLQSILQYI